MSPLVFPLLCPSTAPARTCSDLTSSAAHSRCHQTSPIWSLGATVLQLKPRGSSFPATQPCCKPWEKCSLCEKPGKEIWGKNPQCSLVSPKPYRPHREHSLSYLISSVGVCIDEHPSLVCVRTQSLSVLHWELLRQTGKLLLQGSKRWEWHGNQKRTQPS